MEAVSKCEKWNYDTIKAPFQTIRRDLKQTSVLGEVFSNLVPLRLCKSESASRGRFEMVPFCVLRMSSTVSRVLYRMIIYLDCTLPHSSFMPYGTKRDIPESTTGRRIAFCFVLLRVGFTQPLTLPQERWSLTPPFHPYRPKSAVSFLLH